MDLFAYTDKYFSFLSLCLLEILQSSKIIFQFDNFTTIDRQELQTISNFLCPPTPSEKERRELYNWGMKLVKMLDLKSLARLKGGKEITIRTRSGGLNRKMWEVLPEWRRRRYLRSIQILPYPPKLFEVMRLTRWLLSLYPKVARRNLPKCMRFR